MDGPEASAPGNGGSVSAFYHKGLKKKGAMLWIIQQNDEKFPLRSCAMPAKAMRKYILNLF